MEDTCFLNKMAKKKKITIKSKLQKKIKVKKILRKTKPFTVVLKQKPKKSMDQPSSFFTQELNEDIDETNLFLK